MNFILTSIVLIGMLSNWQANEDVRLVTESIIESFATDSIKVFHRYDNFSLYERLEEYKLFYDYDNSEKNDSIEFDVWLALFDEDLVINFYDVNIKFYEELKYLKRAKNKKILSKNKYVSRKKGKNIRLISKPIISVEGNKAFCYISYYCGPLCGSGGIQLFEKKNGNWIMVEMVEEWIS